MKKLISLEQKLSCGSWSHRVSEQMGSGDGGSVMEQELLDREPWDHRGCGGMSLASRAGGALLCVAFPVWSKDPTVTLGKVSFTHWEP